MEDPKGRGGFDPERMRSQFNEMWRSARDQLDELKDVVLKASQTAKVKLDATFLRRERDRLYQRLGEETYLLIEEGRVTAAPEQRDTIDHIHAIVEQLAEEEAAAAWAAGSAHHEGTTAGYGAEEAPEAEAGMEETAEDEASAAGAAATEEAAPQPESAEAAEPAEEAAEARPARKKAPRKSPRKKPKARAEEGGTESDDS